MPRRARLAMGGIPWNIIQRGNNRSACFFNDVDYHRYLTTLFDQSRAWDCEIHAYVLMTNHVHLLLTPKEAEGPGLLMKHLGQRYVQYINRTYRRSGTLWEGRFKSTLVQSSQYILACYRYIELNPVRAGMVDHPGEYRWSSYGSNGQGLNGYELEPHEEYLALGTTREARFRCYRDLFKAEVESKLIDEIRISTNSNYALGSARFRDEIEEALGQRAKPRKRGRPPLTSTT